jgi:hypothetical protein
MKGSIQQHNTCHYFYVAWSEKGKLYTISRYRGFLCRDGEMPNLKGREMAERILSLMRAGFENGTFRIEKWIGQVNSDVVPYLLEWVQEVGKTLTPANT